MEALQRLEMTQGMLCVIRTRGLSSNHGDGDEDADRFLAEFLLFLVQPCGNLNTEDKCGLISDFLQKLILQVSPEVFKEAHLLTGAKGYQLLQTESHLQSCMEKSTSLNLSEAEKLPKVGLDAMKRSNSTLEDFCRSYFMFHGMDVKKPEEIFKHLPILSFTESYIYQLDALNEQELYLPSNTATCSRTVSNHLLHKCHKVTYKTLEKSVTEHCGCDAFDPLIRLLQSQGLLTDRLCTELKSGVEYWALERKLCHALTNKNKILIDDVMRAIHLKSFDYRVLNLLLCQLRGQEVNEQHMEFLSVSEFLVEISDDLYDYEADVMDNCFNVLRLFVGVYGASTAPSMLAKCISEAEEKYERLASTLDSELSTNYLRRCEEATKEGGATSGHSLGTWSIPPVIVDEESFRSRCR